jgi:UDP-N-acetylmuramate dehydrogenase
LAQQVSAAWIDQKSKVQPMNSAGSAFANPSLETCQKLWGEQKSTGWIIDHELNLKGFAIGDAQISLQHSNFIVNRGHATATDYYQLVKHVQKLVHDHFGFDLVPEVKFLGKF